MFKEKKMSTITALGRGDLKNVQRDSWMLFLLAYPLILGLVLRWLLPWVTAGLQGTFDLTPYHLLLTSFFGVLILPMLTGYLTGFLLLDERDQNTLTALMVTPLSMQSYALYRIASPIVLSIVGILIVVPLIGIAVLPVEQLLPIALAGSLLAPIFAFLLTAFAANKVQGFAVMKGMGTFLIGPLVAWFVPEPWQWLLGIFPTYWPVKAYWLAAAGEPYLWLLAVGAVYAIGLTVVLLKRFEAGLYR